MKSEPLPAAIRALRTRRGLSLDALAEGAGISRCQVVNLERGRADNPTVRTLIRLGAALGVSPAALFRAAVASHDGSVEPPAEPLVEAPGENLPA